LPYTGRKPAFSEGIQFCSCRLGPRARLSPASDTKLHSNEFKCKTPKFLKNRQRLNFQKLAGGGFASAIPICFLLKAN
jgi:hypothetical protein